MLHVNLPFRTDLFRVLVRDLSGLLADLFPASIDQMDSKGLLHLFCRLCLPPVKFLEDVRLHALAGAVLEHEEIGTLQAAFDRDGAQDRLAQLHAVRGKDRAAQIAQIGDDLPVPHFHGSKTGRNDDHGQLVALEHLIVAIGGVDHLREQDRISLIRQRRTDRNRLQQLRRVTVQLLNALHLNLQLGLFPFVDLFENQRYQFCFHIVILLSV